MRTNFAPALAAAIGLAFLPATAAGEGSAARAETGTARPASSDEEAGREAVLRRIEALERELSELKRTVTERDAASPGEAAPGKPGPLPAAGVTAVRVEPGEEAPRRKSAGLAGYDDGFFLASPDKSYRLKLEALMQADSRWFLDGSQGEADRFTIRRARLDLKGRLAERYGFRLQPDFAGSSLSLQDAYLEVEFAKWINLRAGKFKTPFGIERLQSSADIPFVERGLPDNIVPNRDIGVQLFGEMPTVVWAFAVTNGVPDGSSGDSDVNDGVDVTARLFARPFAASMYSPLRGAGLGIAGNFGRQQGKESSDELSSHRTSARGEAFFRWRDDGDGTTFADGDRWRVSPQASWFEGPVGVLGEYVRSEQAVRFDDERARIASSAWQLRASVVLTGEDASYKGVEPDRPFDFGRGQWGAWEIAFRWAALDVEGEAFRRGFADPDEAARHADALTVAVNWYLNRNVAMYLDYEHSMFGGGSKSGDRADEDVLLTRMQVQF